VHVHDCRLLCCRKIRTSPRHKYRDPS
jgi:hypothetical protein